MEGSGVMSEVFLRRLSRWQAADARTELGELHAAAYGYRDAGFRPRFAEHVQQPDFDMVLAAAPLPVGCAYGFLIERDGGWWDRFSTVPAELVELTEVTASRRLFCLAELMVRPEHRRRGLGGRLHDRLLARAEAPVAVALLTPGDASAHDAFVSWGWSKRGEMTPRDDAKPLEAWCLRLDG